jgi:hypothetical protein
MLQLKVHKEGQNMANLISNASTNLPVGREAYSVPKPMLISQVSIADKPSRDAYLCKVAYRRDDSNYDELVTCLMAKVQELKSSLAA